MIIKIGKGTMISCLSCVGFILQCVAIIAPNASNHLFSCDFETDICQMSALSTDNFTWSVANLSLIATHAPSLPAPVPGDRYIYANTSDRSIGARATIATTELHHIGRVCTVFDMYITGGQFGDVHLYKKEEYLTEQSLWMQSSAGSNLTVNWTTISVTSRLRGVSTKLAFASIPRQQNESIVAIDNVDVVTGCCYSDSCPAEWSSWSSWSPCPINCSDYNQTRSRFCDNPRNLTHCTGDGHEMIVCPLDSSCPGQWLPWTRWSDCDAGCGLGNKRRTRNCTRPHPQSVCAGDDDDIVQCQPAVDCPSADWSPWSTWGECDRGCGLGEKTRTRTCSSLSSQRCVGSDVQSQVCDLTRDCPARWSAWTRWSDCDAGCGVGSKTRTRHCITVQIAVTCPGVDTETSACEISEDCVATWQTWDYWSECDGGCGTGFKHRQRDCRRPFQTSTCYGRTEESVRCRRSDCEVHWSTWSEWSACDLGCGFGVKHRTRECITLVEGRRCMGDRTQPRACNQADLELCRLCPYGCRKCGANNTLCEPGFCIRGYVYNNETSICIRDRSWKFIQIMTYIMPLSIVTISCLCFTMIGIYVTQRHKPLKEACQCRRSNADADAPPVYEVLAQKVRRKSWNVDESDLTNPHAHSLRLESPDTKCGSRDIYPGSRSPEGAVSMVSVPESSRKHIEIKHRLQKSVRKYFDKQNKRYVTSSSSGATKENKDTSDRTGDGTSLVADDVTVSSSSQQSTAN